MIAVVLQDEVQQIQGEEDREAAAEQSATAAAAHRALLRAVHLEALAALPHTLADPLLHPELPRLLQALPLAAASWATAHEQLAAATAAAVVRPHWSALHKYIIPAWAASSDKGHPDGCWRVCRRAAAYCAAASFSSVY